ncbi:MAG: hypothetical protein WKF97_09875 [Chitinophagaceae bacterium]
MKRLLLLVIVLFVVKTVLSQAMLGKVEYQRNQQPATIIELPFSVETLEGAIKDHLISKGSKPAQSKGFTLYKNVQLALSDASSSDLYFKIEPKSRKEKQKSVIYMMVAKPNENVATRSGEDVYGMQQAQSFLNDIEPIIETYSLNLQIKEQEEIIKRAETKHTSLVNDFKDLEKRKKSLEEKLQENIIEQEKQKVEVEKQKELLQSLNFKKKPI